MNPRTRFATTVFAAVMFLVTSGCVVVSNGSHSGNVTFLWSFNGQSCALVPGVTAVTIEIPGQTLDQNGTYACSTNGTAGITLLSFAAGTYSYTIEGRGQNGTILYQDAGSFTVNGDVTVNATMTANQSAPGAVSIGWTFPPGQGGLTTCAATSGPVSAVTVSIDGATGQEVSCAEGETQAGATFTNLTPGSHDVELSAHDSQGFVYYTKSSTFTVVAGTTAVADFTFAWNVGSLPLSWTINTNTTAGVSCSNLGTVYLNLAYVSGSQTYYWSQNNIAVPCVGGTPYIYGYIFDYVYVGSYTVLFFSDAAGQHPLTTTPSSPQVTVAPGDFSTTPTSSITILR